MKHLKPQDFKLQTIDNGRFKYMSCQMCNGYELIIERGESGINVGVFDERGILAVPRRKVYWVGGKDVMATFKVAVDQASQLYEEALSRLSPGLGASHYDSKKGVLTLP